LTSFVIRRPVAALFVLAYLWAWALWGYWIPAMPPGGLVISAPFLVMALAGGLGPTLAAIVLSAVVAGRRGVGDLLGGALRWRVHPGWYAVALFMVPAMTVAALLLEAPLLGPPA
jgi:hypothetical protein